MPHACWMKEGSSTPCLWEVFRSLNVITNIIIALLHKVQGAHYSKKGSLSMPLVLSNSVTSTVLNSFKSLRGTHVEDASLQNDLNFHPIVNWCSLFSPFDDSTCLTFMSNTDYSFLKCAIESNKVVEKSSSSSRINMLSAKIFAECSFTWTSRNSTSLAISLCVGLSS